MTYCPLCHLTQEDKRWLLYGNEYWSVFLADKQDYVGRCLVMCNRHCDSLSKLRPEEWYSLKSIINALETMLSTELNATMFNWSCLMNDAYKYDPPCPHLHFHLRPRYKEMMHIGNITFLDHEFSHHYNNQAQAVMDDEALQNLFNTLHSKVDIYFTK